MTMTIEDEIANVLSEVNVEIKDVRIREFPGETIVLVHVYEDQYQAAMDLSARLDSIVEDGFVTVRSTKREGNKPTRIHSLDDTRVSKLVADLNENVRASEDFREFRYIEGAADKISLATSRRHHLVFGRRGVGKTALLLESRSRLERSGEPCVWINLKTFSNTDSDETVANVVLSLLQQLQANLVRTSRSDPSLSQIDAITDTLQTAVLSGSQTKKVLGRIIPPLQLALRRYAAAIGNSTYVFLDDAHTINRSVLPSLLDNILSLSTDNNCWVKVAGIQHQMKYFDEVQKIGFEVPHDAQLIDLDVTLENPGAAREFLVSLLDDFVRKSNISSRSYVFREDAIDRLVLASGGVPRDFLVLSGRSIAVARERERARNVGVQDVNSAAGRYRDAKLKDLQDDAAANQNDSTTIVDVLNFLRDLVLTENQFTFFKISLSEKESFPDRYRVIQQLADLRLIHLLRSSISDQQQPGIRFEVYLIDISEYSGQRLRQKLQTLEFKKDAMVLRTTGTNSKGRSAKVPRDILTLLRSGPTVPLANLPMRT